MSQKEARRPGLVQAALDGKITNKEGAKALGMCVRTAWPRSAADRRRNIANGDLDGNGAGVSS